MPLKASTVTYQFSLDEIKNLLVTELQRGGIPATPKNTDINYTVSDTSDDRFGHSPNYQLTKVEVVVREPQSLTKPAQP